MKVDMSSEAVTERLKMVNDLWKFTIKLMKSTDIGVCSSCKMRFSYRLIHNGFNESSYAYCDTCGKTALFSGWFNGMPQKALENLHEKISQDVEPLIEACDCGGKFKHDAKPRCPNCRHELSATDAAEFIERNAPGSPTGWRWQRSWNGMYCIVIEDNRVEDNWKK